MFEFGYLCMFWPGRHRNGQNIKKLFEPSDLAIELAAGIAAWKAPDRTHCAKFSSLEWQQCLMMAGKRKRVGGSQIYLLPTPLSPLSNCMCIRKVWKRIYENHPRKGYCKQCLCWRQRDFVWTSWRLPFYWPTKLEKGNKCEAMYNNIKKWPCRSSCTYNVMYNSTSLERIIQLT